MFRVSLLAVFSAMTLVQAQDLPEGKGRDLIMRLCVDCHDAQIIAAQHNNKDGWASLVDSMVARGAGGTKEELDTIVEYLAKNFPEEKPAEKKIQANRR